MRFLFSNFFSKVKCEHYWPESDEPLILGDLDIRLQSDKHFASYSIRQMTLSYEVPNAVLNKLNEIQRHFKHLINPEIYIRTDCNYLLIILGRNQADSSVSFYGMAGSRNSRNSGVGTLPETGPVQWVLWPESHASSLQVGYIPCAPFFLCTVFS